jgi:hypothetical protein
MHLTMSNYNDEIWKRGGDPNSVRIFIDDVQTAMCVEVNDEEGWATCYVKDSSRHGIKNPIETERVTGTIRIEWDPLPPKETT